MILEITIKNWDAYNPRSDAKTCSWYRQSNDFFSDPEFYGVKPEIRLTWIFILCMASKKLKGTIKLNAQMIADATGVTLRAVSESLAYLKKIGCITTSEENPVISTRKVTSCNISADLMYPSATNEQNEQNERTNERTLPAPTSGVREAYAAAYYKRYQIKPVWAVKENSLAKKLVGSVGLEAATQLASAYLEYPDPWHVKQKHPFALLVSQLDKVRVELQNPSRMLDHKRIERQIEQRVDVVETKTVEQVQAERLAADISRRNELMSQGMSQREAEQTINREAGNAQKRI